MEVKLNKVENIFSFYREMKDECWKMAIIFYKRYMASNPLEENEGLKEEENVVGNHFMVQVENSIVQA